MLKCTIYKVKCISDCHNSSSATLCSLSRRRRRAKVAEEHALNINYLVRAISKGHLGPRNGFSDRNSLFF